MDFHRERTSAADFNSDLFCTKENVKCNGYCRVRIGAWRAFLGIKQELETFQGSVGEEGPLKKDDLPQAPPRPDGGCCLCSSADQRETGFWDWDQILYLEVLDF